MTTDIVPAGNMAALDSLDVQAREVAITGMLDQARTWLAHAVESTAPAQDIANFKAYIATAAETAKRLKVSKEIQVDAEVMVRRSERALGQAIRQGQEAGEIASQGRNYARNAKNPVTPGSSLAPVTTFAPAHDLHGSGRQPGLYAVTDDVTDDEFEEALDRAQEEQNVSRANVVRKVREVKSGAERQAEKWDRVAEMADQGYTSTQIAREVGAHEGTLREGARARGIEIRADRIVGRTRRLDVRRIVGETVGQAEALANTASNLISVEAIRAADIEPDEIQTWVDSLTSSIRTLSKALKTIKESNS